MKKGIHPEYKEATISCGCGEKIHTRSTKGDVAVGICSKCHPFFTGKQKFVDAAGRVEKFQRRYGWGAKKVEDLGKANVKPAEEVRAEEKEEPKEESSEE